MIIKRYIKKTLEKKHGHHATDRTSGCKVKRKAKIRKQYNQVPRLTQDTLWESDKNTRKHNTQESQEISPFPAGDRKEQARQHNKDKHKT